MIKGSDFLPVVEQVRTHPTGMMRAMIEALEASLGGQERVLDPTSPFVFLMEASCTLGTSAMQQSESLNRIHYPNAANTYNDLFYHMSDEDYVDVFSTPARTNYLMMIGMDEILSRAAIIPGSNDTRRLVIPKHSAIHIADMEFTLQYPVVIEVTSLGTVKCYIDTSKTSPIQNITNNELKWMIKRVNDVRCVIIEFPILQLAVKSNQITVNTASIVTKSFTFNDLYHYTRVYNRVNNRWVEMRTTHSNEVYDPTIPTAILKIANGVVDVSIPQIYLTRRMVSDAIRVDIYTTRGPLDMSLANYDPASYSYNWQDLDQEDNTYSAPLSNFSNFSIFSNSQVVGGSKGLTFSQLRARVINRSQVTAGLAITDHQIPDFISTMGYGLVTDVDNITDRTFLATRDIPAPKNGITATGIDVSVHTFYTDMQDLTTHSTVRDHGHRITVLPKTLYSTQNGKLSIVSDEVLNTLTNPQITTPDALANAVNSKNYLYSPYYYVYDVSETSFDVRAYDLDAPYIEDKHTVDTNHSFNALFTINSTNIEKTAQGYRVTIAYDPKSNIKDYRIEGIKVQMSYAQGSSTRGYITGEFQGSINEKGLSADGTYVWAFDITTDYDINNNHQLVLTPYNYPVDLIHDFEIVTMLFNILPPGATPSQIDTYTNASLLPDFVPGSIYTGVAHDRITVKFGERLTHLWSRTRTVPESIEYMTYEEDVYLHHTKDMPEYDKMGVPKVIQNQSTGKWETVLVAKKGDLVYDHLGNKEIKFHKGRVILDEYDRPRIKGGQRGIIREVDLVLFDGLYYFANDSLTSDYTSEVVATITSWVTEDIREIKKSLLPRTEIYFYPRVSAGNVTVMTADGVSTEIPAKQNLTITFYVSDVVQNDQEIQEILRNGTALIISSYFKENVLTKDALLSKIREALKENIKGVAISGFLNDRYDIVVMYDDAQRPAVGKSLVALPNYTLRVVDTITYDFKAI